MSNANEISLKLDLDKDTKQIRILKGELKDLGDAFNGAHTFEKKLISISSKFAVAAKVLSSTLGAFYSSGINYNSTLEDLEKSLTKLKIANSSNVSSQGNSLTLMEKQILATREAKAEIGALNKINGETPHNIKQMSDMYTTLYQTMGRSGANQKDLMEITKKISIATGDAGVKFEDVVVGLGNLSSGSVKAGSDFDVFLRSIGLSNEKLRESKDVVGTVKEALQDVNGVTTFSGAVDALGGSFHSLAGAITKDSFESLKEGTLSLKEFFDSLNNPESIAKLDEIQQGLRSAVFAGLGTYGVVKAYNSLGVSIAKLKALQEADGGLFSSGEKSGKKFAGAISLGNKALSGLGTALKATPFALVSTALYVGMDAFQDYQEKLDILGESFDKQSLKMKNFSKSQLEFRALVVDEEIQSKREDLSKAITESKGGVFFDGDIEGAKKKVKALREEISELRKSKQNISEAIGNFGKEDSLQSNGNSATETISYTPPTTSIDSWKRYFEEIGDFSSAWAIEETRLREEYTSLEAKELDKIVGLRKKAYMKSKVKDDDSLLGSFKQRTLTTRDKLDAEYKKDKKTANSIKDKGKREEALGIVDEQYKNDSKDLEEQELIQKAERWKTYYQTIGDLGKAWVEEEKILRAKNSDLGDERLNKLLEVEQKNFLGIKEPDPIKFDLQLTGFDDVSNAFATLGNSYQDLISSNEAYQEKVAGLTGEQKRAADFNFATSTISTIGDMTGALGAFYDEDDKRRKKQEKLAKMLHASKMAMQIAELTMTLTNESTSQAEGAKTALVKALEAKYPLNIIAYAQVAAMLGSLGIAIGGGGSSGRGSSGENFEANIKNIEDNNQPILDRLDRQIELLEELGFKGTATKTELDLARKTFDSEYAIFMEESFKGATHGAYREYQRNAHDSFVANMQIEEDKLGFNIFDKNYSTTWKGESYLTSATFNYDSLREDYNFAKLLENMATTGTFSFMFDKGWGGSGLGPGEYGKQQAKIKISEFQELLSEFTLSVIGSLNTIKEGGKELEDFYDKLTGTRKFEEQRIDDAYGDVNRLMGKGKFNKDGFNNEAFTSDFSQYLEKEAIDIQQLSEFFTPEKLDVLIAQDPTKLTEQIKILEDLERETGLSFENGAKEVLDYIDSIELITKTLANSKKNVNSFNENLKTPAQKLLEQHSTLGIEDVKKSIGLKGTINNLDDLSLVMEKLSADTYGLTDAELKYLELKKQQIETSNKNIEAFENSFKTQQELLSAEGIELGVVELPKNIDGLRDVFNRLKDDTEGLTDAELKYLNAVKQQIEVSESNKQKWLDSFKSEEQLLKEQAAKLGVGVPASMKELQKIYKELSSDTDGLTDVEYQYLEAVKKRIEADKKLVDLSGTYKTIEDDILSQVDVQIALKEAYSETRESIEKRVNELSGVDISKTLEEMNTLINGFTNADESNQAFDYINSFYDEQYKILEEDKNNKIALLEKEEDVLRSLQDYADDLVISNLSDTFQTEALRNKFYTTFGDMKTAISNGDEDMGDLGSRSLNYATQYLDSYKETATNSAMYALESARVAEMLSSYTGSTGNATLDDLESAIEDLKKNETGEMRKLRGETLKALGFLDVNVVTKLGEIDSTFMTFEKTAETYLGKDSDIVTYLKEMTAGLTDLPFSEYTSTKETEESYSTLDKAKAYLNRYTDIANAYNNGSVTKVHGEDMTKEAWALYHYKNYGVDENRTWRKGGFTGTGALDEVAGLVHKNEYVAPAYQVQKYPELFRQLDSERNGFKNGGFTSEFKNPFNNDSSGFKEVISELKDIKKIAHDQEQRVAHLQRDNNRMRKILEREELIRESA